ncbi:MAG: tetratricopeptide repeat protein [Geobacteraceae bacterium]|nr:tetratricopeptide repeat protein [Geobacteraceae bacterium]
MSTQKDKFLASAQKYIQKGQFERALKDYEQVVTADPKDVKHRQKLAELMVRCSRREDAIREYETIAKYYDENGFYLKSIAVYKQIQRLDPSSLDISIALAQLNEKQGLVGNALIEYKTVFDHHQKSGQVDEAIKILEKMKGVDPQNVDIRLKLAETCFGAGHKDKAYQEFTGVAMSLKDKGNKEIFERVCQRIQDLFPDKKEGMLDILASQVKNGQVEESLPKLKKLLDDEPGNTKVMTLLAEAYRISGEEEKCREMLHGILGIDPGDAEVIKKIIEIDVEAGSLEEGVTLLRQYVPALMQAGCFADVERYYTKLLEHAPYDIRLLEGLKSLYETTGDQSKLSDVQVSINILSKKSLEPDIEEPEEAPVEHAWSEAEVQDFPWQDEIDLSFAPEVEPGSIQETQETGPVLLKPDDISSGGETQPESAGDVFDIDISFDLTEMQEMEVADESGSAQEEPSQAVKALSGETGAAGEITVPDFLSGLEVESDNFTSESDLQSEEHCITLSEELPEAEIILEPEPLEEKPVSEPGTGLFDMDILEETSDKYSQEGIFTKFKESLGSQVDSSDTETRYNLGIAYMEMALYDEAIGEFRAARKNPARFLDCITLEGMCCGKKGDFASAEKVFLDALSLEGLDSDRVLCLRYELGVMYESAGNREGALKVFGEIFQASPGFRDTMKKIARLSGEENGSLDLSDINDADLELDELA